MEWTGRRLGEQGRYTIQAELGAGAMGRVFRAHDAKLQREVVIKVLADTYATNPRVRERFVNEALIQANILHPNIVRAVDAVEEGMLLAIVMDFVRGPSLEQYLLQRGGSLPWGEFRYLILPVMDAVATAHHNKVIHRDLKPGNILLDTGPSGFIPKVADFGIAKLLANEGGAAKTRAGAVLGTPSYMPPEQLKGAEDLDGRADVYALGAIMYQLATGQLPYGEHSEYQVTHFVLSGHAPIAPSTLNPHLPAGFDGVVAKAMAANRDDRYATVMELKAATEALGGTAKPLATVLEGDGPGVHAATLPGFGGTGADGPGPPASPARATTGPPPGEPKNPSRVDSTPAAQASRSSAMVLAVSAALVGALVVGIAVFAMRDGAARPPSEAAADAPVGMFDDPPDSTAGTGSPIGVAPSESVKPEPDPRVPPAEPVVPAAGAAAQCPPSGSGGARFGPAVWNPGNLWVYKASRASTKNIADEVAPISYYLLRTVISVTSHPDGKLVTLRDAGGPSPPRVYDLVVTDSCVRRPDSSENDYCLSGTGSSSPYSVGGETLNAYRANATALQQVQVDPFVGVVVEVGAGGRKQTQTTLSLAGYRVGNCSAGDTSQEPLTCDWNAEDMNGKSSPSSSDDLFAIAARYGLSPTKRFAVPLSGRHGARQAIGWTDGRSTVARIVGATGELGSGFYLSGPLQSVKAWQPPAGGSEIVQFMTYDESSARMHLYEFKAGGSARQFHVAASLPGSGTIVRGYLSSNLDTCQFMFARRYKNATIVANFTVGDGGLERTGGSLDTRYE